MPLATPTLAVADNQNGTATATITDSTAGTTNTVYTQSFSGQLGASIWTSRGSRTGNGTVLLTLDAGHYFSYVLSVLSGESAVSSVIYFNATSGDEAVHYQCLIGAQARIRALLLEDIANASIIALKLPYENRYFGQGKPLDLPGIILSQLGTPSMNPTAGTNERDDIGHPVVVSIFAADNQDLVTNQNKYMLWYQRIAAAFRHQRLSGAPLVHTCFVEPGPTIDPAAFNVNVFHSAMTLRFMSRETRGL